MNIVNRVKNIIMTPKTEWPVIAGEDPNATQILTGYVIPLALIPTVAMVIGYGFIGSGYVHSLNWGIAMGIISFVSTVLGVYLTAFVVDFLAGNFGSEKNFGRAMQLVAYSYTPAWIGGIFNLLPVIGWLGSLLGLYGLYLLYLGLPHTMKTPEDKVVVYMIVTIVVLIIVYLIIGAIMTAIVLGIFGLGAMSMMR